MKTIKILKSRVNDLASIFIEDLTVYNKDYWDLIEVEVEDSFNIYEDDYNEYLNKNLT